MRIKLLIPEIIVLVVALCCLFGTSSAQQYNLHYKLLKGNDTVGELTVIEYKSVEGHSIHTQLKATVSALVFHINLTDEKQIVYKNRILHSEIVTRGFFSGSDDKSITKLQGHFYSDGKNAIPKLSGEKAINFSMTMLYTTEPVNLKRIYSEFHQQFVPIDKTGPNVYRIKTPEGQIGSYYYEKGICIRIETETNLASISTILVNNSITSK